MVQVGNCKSLIITSTKTSNIQTHETSFMLNTILLVPDMKYNLLSVSKFTKDNAHGNAVSNLYPI